MPADVGLVTLATYIASENDDFVSTFQRLPRVTNTYAEGKQFGLRGLIFPFVMIVDDTID